MNRPADGVLVWCRICVLLNPTRARGKQDGQEGGTRGWDKRVGQEGGTRGWDKKVQQEGATRGWENKVAADKRLGQAGEGKQVRANRWEQIGGSKRVGASQYSSTR
jgi:hypothetical protein